MNFITEVVQDVLGCGATPHVLCPETNREADLLKLATDQEWAFAVLLLNNILYSPDRSVDGSLKIR